jgi:hypothetical protein
MKRKPSKPQPAPEPAKPRRIKSQRTRTSHPWIQMGGPPPPKAGDDEA